MTTGKQYSLPSNEKDHHRTRPNPPNKGWKVCRVRPLVPVGSIPRGTSTPGLSNTCSTCGLQTLRGASRNPNLGAGFPLRCFQRLSLPNVANRPCRWRDNRHTRGPSTQVLSYYGQASSGFQRAQRIETKLSHDVLNPCTCVFGKQSLPPGLCHPRKLRKQVPSPSGVSLIPKARE